MKILKYLIYLLIVVISCESNKKIQNQKTTSLNQTKTVVKDSIKTNEGFLVGKKNRINYGNIKRGDTIRQEFIFYNKGSEETKILGYDPSCNCTSASLEKNTIAVGDSTKFTMVIDTSNKHNGPNEVTTTIKTNGKRKFYLLSTKFDIVD